MWTITPEAQRDWGWPRGISGALRPRRGGSGLDGGGDAGPAGALDGTAVGRRCGVRRGGAVPRWTDAAGGRDDADPGHPTDGAARRGGGAGVSWRRPSYAPVTVTRDLRAATTARCHVDHGRRELGERHDPRRDGRGQRGGRRHIHGAGRGQPAAVGVGRQPVAGGGDDLRRVRQGRRPTTSTVRLSDSRNRWRRARR